MGRVPVQVRNRILGTRLRRPLLFLQGHSAPRRHYRRSIEGSFVALESCIERPQSKSAIKRVPHPSRVLCERVGILTRKKECAPPPLALKRKIGKSEIE